MFCLLSFAIVLSVFAQDPDDPLWDDPFAPFLNDISSILNVLGETETATYKRSEILLSSKKGANKIYGILYTPKAAGPKPAVLVLHDEKSSAAGVDGQGAKLAENGYVVLAIDQPSFVGPDSKSDGAWKNAPAGPGPRLVFDPINGSTLLDAEVAVIEAVNFLVTNADVDKTKVGVIGYGWGAFSAIFVTGTLGTKIAASYAVYGSGYLYVASGYTKAIAEFSVDDEFTWSQAYDAGFRFDNWNIHGAHMRVSPTNDAFFYPPAVQSTFQNIPCIKHQVWGPNLDHTEQGTQDNYIPFFDFYLKNDQKGTGFIYPGVEGVKGAGGDIQVIIQANITSKENSIASVKGYFSVVDPAADIDKAWTTRKWQDAPAAKEYPDYKLQPAYSFAINGASANTPIDFFATITDAQGFTTSTEIVRVIIDAKGNGQYGDIIGDNI